MPGAGEKLRLLNGGPGRKETLANRDPLRVYLALPARLRPQTGQEPDPASFETLTSLRIYFAAELLLGLLRQEGRTVQLVETPAEADLTLAGSDFQGQSGRGLLLTIAAPAAGEAGDFKFNEARYLMYSAPHTASLPWSAGALAGARAALGRLKEYLQRFEKEVQPGDKLLGVAAKDWRTQFYEQLYDDLNTPRALAVLWTMLQSDLSGGDKYALLADFCHTLNLGKALGLPPEKTVLIATNGVEKSEQPTARPERPGERKKVQPITGYESGRNPPPPRPKGKEQPPKPIPKNQRPVAVPSEERRRIIGSRDVRSHLAEPDRFDFTVSLVAHNNLAQVRTTVESLLQYIPRSSRSIEVIAVEIEGTDGTADYLAGVAAQVANFRVVYARQGFGEAAGRNVAFRQGRGRYLLLLDAELKLTGDLFEELAKLLKQEDADGSLALYGLYPVALEREGQKVQGFAPISPPTGSNAPEVEALESGLLCLRRKLVEEVGFMDEHFRFPYALSLDYSFNFRDKGYKVRVLPGLARLLSQPPGFKRADYGLSPEQQERQRHKNWQLFLRSWDLG